VRSPLRGMRMKKLGVNKGDRVALYMPMIPELSVAMLACARIGAVHSVVFGGFSAKLCATGSVTARPKCSSPLMAAIARRPAAAQA